MENEKNKLSMKVSRMKKIIIKILCSFIWNKEKRKNLRKLLIHTSIKGLISLYKFNNYKVRPNSVLLIEANEAHGEVISGYLEYFRNMGFNIDVLLNIQLCKENPFCRLDISNVNFFISDYGFLKYFFSNNRLNEYSNVIIMTSAAYFMQTDNQYSGILNIYPQLRSLKNLYIVEHDLRDVKRFSEENYLKNNKIFTLGHFDRGIFACPVLFGNINITPKNKVTTFITVGGIDKARKNHEKLIEALQKLEKDNLEYRVIIVGNGKLDNIPENMRNFVKITGRLNFSDMFSQMEEADFFLPLLDENNPQHECYIKTKVTGSAQLIYAFAKVPVIHEKFASFYGFTKENSVIYSDLYSAMKSAILMERNDYEQYQKNLLKLSSSLVQETQENFDKVMKG